MNRTFAAKITGLLLPLALAAALLAGCSSTSSSSNELNGVPAPPVSVTDGIARMGNEQVGYVSVPEEWTAEFYDGDVSKTFIIKNAGGAEVIYLAYEPDRTEGAEAWIDEFITAMQEQTPASDLEKTETTLGEYQAWRMTGRTESLSSKMSIWIFTDAENKHHCVILDIAEGLYDETVLMIEDSFSLSA